jgi:hypothetical protein
LPAVPFEEAVILMLFPPVTETLLDAKNPTPPFPCPVIELVAVSVPPAVNAAVILIPFPPVVALMPPVQLANVTGPFVEKAPAATLTPSLEVPVPPAPVNVTRPVVVPVLHAALT